MMIQFVFILALVSGSVLDVWTDAFLIQYNSFWPYDQTEDGNWNSGFFLGGRPYYGLRLNTTEDGDTESGFHTDNVDDDVPVSKNCNLGWREYNDSCYSFNKEAVSWFEAASTCQIYGASLVQVESQEENDWLGIQLGRANIENAWLGGSARLHKKVWEWVPSFRRIGAGNTQSGSPEDAWNTMSSNLTDWLPGPSSPTTYLNWAPGEPNNNDPQRRREDCLEIHEYHNYKWNDMACERNLKFICEKKAVEQEK